MAKQHDEAREHRIIYEVIVDTYDQYEEAMSWFICLDEGLVFPMDATVKLRLRGGKTEEKAAKIVEVDPKSEDSLTLRLGMTEGKSVRVQYISPEYIVSINTSEGNLEILNDWLYWHGHPLL